MSKFQKPLSTLPAALAIFLVLCMLSYMFSFMIITEAAFAEDYPQWDPTVAYPKDSIVMHKGAVWKAKWYNVNEEPMDVQGNAWECIIPKPPEPPEPPENPDGYDLPRVFFDDFNMYNTSSDQALLDFGYEVSDRTGGPGPGGCVWSKNNVTFVNDSELPGNKFLRLTATTRGSGETTVQAEILAPRKFLYGTYAARIKFTNEPAYGPDGDQIVETFYTISPWILQNSPDYGEMDFEYLANGGWGKPAMTMWNTTWETASIRTTTPTTRDFSGWHTCVIQSTSTETKYYIDGQLLASHDIYAPETEMFLSFNLWFIDGIWAGGNQERAYIQDVDWVYYAKDVIMAPAQAECNVQYYRNNSVSRKDTLDSSDPIPPVLKAASISVDDAHNTGNYTITVNVPANNSANTLKLYEQNDNTLLLERSLTVDMPAVQTFTYSFSDKEPGIYSYVAVTSDGTGSLNSNIITVTVEEEDGGDDEEEDPELVTAAAGRPITASDYIWGNASYVTDGDKNTNNYMGVTQNLQWIQIDLGESKKIHQINLWHYYGDGRTYHDVIVRLSDTPDFSGGVTTVFNNDNDNSAGFGYGSDQEYAETADGNSIPVNGVSARYVRLYTNGSTANIYNHYVEVEVMVAGQGSGSDPGDPPDDPEDPPEDPPVGGTNVALGKSVTSSIGKLGSIITDGDKNTYNFQGVHEGLQWVQIDLGQVYNISMIKVWHYFGDGRKYRDVIVRASTSPDFSGGAVTLFNNDKDNSAGFGAGSDDEYAETSEGKTIVCKSQY